MAQHQPGLATLALTAAHPLATVVYCDCRGIWSLRTADLLAQDVVLEDVCYVFLEDGNITGWYKDHCSQKDRRSILASFQVPDFLSNQTAAALNGYFGCKPSYDDADKLATLTTWLRVLTKKILRVDGSFTENGKDYLWYEMDFFVHWTASNSCRVLCINAPPELRVAMAASLVGKLGLPLDYQDPFAMLRLLLDEVIKFCDDNIWRVTKEVRKIEKNRVLRPGFERSHNLLRHINHLVEVKSVAIETIAQLLARQEKSFSILPCEDSLTKSYRSEANEYLAFQLQMMKSLRARVEATRERLQGEINLAFNMLASMDNRIMVSIALLTMVFLPATFISALFSTTFFSFEADGWQSSHKFWVYWVTAVPLTVAVVSTWWKWIGGSLKNVRSRWLGV